MLGCGNCSCRTSSGWRGFSLMKCKQFTKILGNELMSHGQLLESTHAEFLCEYFGGINWANFSYVIRLIIALCIQRCIQLKWHWKSRQDTTPNVFGVVDMFEEQLEYMSGVHRHANLAQSGHIFLPHVASLIRKNCPVCYRAGKIDFSSIFYHFFRNWFWSPYTQRHL